MKKYILILILFISFNGYTQSNWDQNSTSLTLNSQLLGQSIAQGAFYGAGGYGLGMWLSGNRTGWGIVGSLVAVNIPILLEKDYDKKEVWIGKNAGALLMSASLTVGIELTRKGKLSFTLPEYLKKH